MEAPASSTVKSELPTIVIVQGSFQIPKVYEQFEGSLRKQGYPTVHPRFPSCTDVDDPDFPNRSLIDDALAVRSELIRLVEYEHKTVVVVMHSYGGLVGSEAVAKDLVYADRKARGLAGGVIHLFFYAAFLLPEGQSVLGKFGESPNSIVTPDGRFIIKNAQQNLYNDLLPAEAEYWGSLLIFQSHKVKKTVLTRAAWRYIASTYLICEGDQAVPPQYQEQLANMASAHIERCSAGHSPQLSQVEMLVGSIDGALKRAVAELQKKASE
ncbi:uncharacterized protein KY384_004550 [Bacidia gigantensis]|uniref:uncharacterized protein n=1 Tax=Bacidia gigantensis TaxID=2732470 RepID=UPI001D0418B5|nr:uncharacterized protein KY384_004550 [Bacidia gigantensis]KAG8531192.1 hypothetical protein KY384_004550 [Bacidia gigantensis]